MGTQKIYAGAKLREMRTGQGLTQKEFAARLGVSLPYLNQMENNNRPVSTGVVLGLAQEFGIDVTQLTSGEAERMVSDLREAFADPVFPHGAPPLADIRLAAANAPAFSRALLDLHDAYRRTHERLASLDAVLGLDDSAIRPSPWEEVRDFFHYCDNYIDELDRAAEGFMDRPGRQSDPQSTAARVLESLGITLEITETPTIRHFEPGTNHLTLSAQSDTATQTFQMLHQIALLTQNDLLETTLDQARFTSQSARAIARIGLANYFAGAALLPYHRFQDAAEATDHDLERLAGQFGASIEQVAHRLSTLQRPGAKGIPFFFVRVDQAGTITKRHSATRLQFARFGGACPLWNVHQAFETPGRFLRQMAETPDGVQYFCLARDVSKPSGAYDAPVRRYAIGLGCEIVHANRLIYARDMDISKPEAFEPVGISCRICERKNCHQRSVPPLERPLKVDHNHHATLPYSIE